MGVLFASVFIVMFLFLYCLLFRLESCNSETLKNFAGGQEVADDVCQQAPEQAELGGDRPRQSVLRRSLPLPSCWPPRRILCPTA